MERRAEGCKKHSKRGKTSKIPPFEPPRGKRWLSRGEICNKRFFLNKEDATVRNLETLKNGTYLIKGGDLREIKRKHFSLRKATYKESRRLT